MNNVPQESIDLNMIRSALEEIKKNPELDTVARFDENGNYDIKKRSTQKSFLEKLGFKKGKTQVSQTYQPRTIETSRRDTFKKRVQVEVDTAYQKKVNVPYTPNSSYINEQSKKDSSFRQSIQTRPVFPTNTSGYVPKSKSYQDYIEDKNSSQVR